MAVGVKLRDELEGCVSVDRWRQRVAESTFVTYRSWLRAYLRYTGKTADEALEMARVAPDKFVVLDSIQQFIQSLQKTRRFRTQVTMYAAIRSFYMHNRIALPQDPSFKMRAEIPPVERQITIEHLHELIGLASQPWRSMILVKWMALLDTEGLLYVDRHYAMELAEAIRKNMCPVKVTIPGRKHSRNIRPFYTFLGHDSLDSLRQYFERDRGWPKQGEPIWYYPHVRRPINRFGITSAWLRLLRRAKLIPKVRGWTQIGTRYGFNLHNTRDLAISLLNTVSGLNPKCCEFWAGHDIDPLGYNQFFSVKPDYVEDQYRLAEPHLNIISSPQLSSTDLKKRDEELAAMRSQLDNVTELVQRITSGEITIRRKD